MTEDEAKKILENAIKNDGDLYALGWYLAWNKKAKTACLDGEFTAEDLEAISWWMRNH